MEKGNAVMEVLLLRWDGADLLKHIEWILNLDSHRKKLGSLSVT